MLDATEATFELIIRCTLMIASIVDSPTILGRIGVGKSARIYLMLQVAPTMTTHTPVLSDGWFVL